MSKRKQHPVTLPTPAVEDFLARVVWQFENWRKVTERSQGFIIPSLAATDVCAQYQVAGVSGGGRKRIGTDELFSAFVQDARIHFLVVLGENGIGKTASALWWFYHAAKRYIDGKDRNRVPFFLDLKGRPRPLQIEALLAEAFQGTFGVRYSPLSIQDLLLRGSLLLFLDGFDQMASQSDHFQIQKDLEEISKLALRNIILENGEERRFQGNKVLLTLPPHYALNRVLAVEDFSEANCTRLFRNLATKESHRFVSLHFPEMDESQLKAHIIRISEDGITARNLIAMLQDRERIPLLTTPELMQQLLIRSLAACRSEREINIAGLYRAYVGLWIHRSDWRFRLPAEARQMVLMELAYKIVEKGEAFHLHAGELDPLGGQWHVEPEKGDPFQEEMWASDFVEQDGDGNYSFVHTSFLSYLYAEYYFQQIRSQNPRPAPVNQLSESIRTFLKLIIATDKASLTGLDLSGLDISEVNLYQAQMVDAALKKTNFSNSVMVNSNLELVDLTGANLQRAKLTRVRFKDADITAADFSHANLREADLRAARFNGASFRGADLRGVRLQDARLAWVDLQGADLSGANLTGVILSDADLSGADLTGATLNEADLSSANLSRCILRRAEVSHADLTGADLTGADFSGANLTYSNLERANLSLANLDKAHFREANLSRINLDDASCVKTDFRYSTLHRAKGRDGRFKEADFTGADLRETKLNEAEMTWANFSKANLDGADLSDAKLSMGTFQGATLRRTNLSGADLMWADLTRSNLSDADLIGTNLSEADLTEADLTGVDLNTVIMDGATLRDTRLDNARSTYQAPGDVDLPDATLEE